MTHLIWDDVSQAAREVSDEEWAVLNPVPPPAPVSVPSEISNFQARAIMRQTFLKDGSGVSLFSAVDGALRSTAEAVASLPDTDAAKIEALIALDAWDRGSTVLRRGSLTLALQAQFGFTDAETDALFIQASGIVA